MTSLTMKEAIDRLIEALEPMAAMYDAQMEGQTWGYNARVLRIEDLKRARELLDRLKEENMNRRNA